jgi:protein-L-isoaspartate(D-aspartate) O-methyltransferase
MSSDVTQVARNRMVDEQIAARGVLDPHLLMVMKSVPRHLFVPADEQALAYDDHPLPIGHGQTISQPYMVAYMTDALRVHPTDRILEVGTGSGYQAAILGQMAGEVHTIELIPELVVEAARLLASLEYTNIHTHLGDGSIGWLEAAPYQGILVAAAAPGVPQSLLNQLADGGRLIIPVGSRGFQHLELWTRTGQDFEHRVDMAVAFVPLWGENGWK